MNEGDLEPLQWALPESLEIPPDQLRLRLDFYTETIVMHYIEAGVITNRAVSPTGVINALTREVSFSSGLLPPDALWWAHTAQGDTVAIWQRPQVRRVALRVAAFEPPERYAIPMPGLVFLCQSSRAPRVWAAKRRPASPQDRLYHCPTFNVFQSGLVCPGSHHFPENPREIPDSFFQSLFSLTGDYVNRSVKHPGNIRQLWQELDGVRRYPLDDLVPFGRVSDVIGGISI